MKGIIVLLAIVGLLLTPLTVESSHFGIVYRDSRPGAYKVDGYVRHYNATVYAMSGPSYDMTGLLCTRSFVGSFTVSRRYRLFGRYYYYQTAVRGYHFTCP